jgi:N-acetylglucosamine-6-phosphate deacetylase
MPYAIENGEVYKPSKMPEGTVVIVDGNKVVFISPKKARYPNNTEIIDASDKIVTPGFIDMHIHGCAGFDVTDGKHGFLEEMSKFLTEHGVTSFLPTVVSTTKRRIIRAIENVREAQKKKGANVLGLYLEGPYLNVERAGAQNPQYIKDPNLTEVKEILDIARETVKVVALAPEKVNAIEVIKELKKRGIVASAAHTNATYNEMLVAIEAGLSHITHVFNAMRGFNGQEIGAVGAALLHEELTTELIADGVHVHPSAIRMLVKMKGYDKVVLISDAISPTGLPDGKYELGGLEILVKNGISTLRSGVLAGSTLTLDRAVKNVITLANVPVSEAIKMATLNPARVLRLKTKGEIKAGADADIAILDRDFNVQSVMICGELLDFPNCS